MSRYPSSALRLCRTLSLVSAIVAVVTWAQSSAQTPPAGAGSCSALASVSLPNTTITSAQSVAAGAFTPPQGGRGGAPAAWTDLPAFCRVSATTKMLNSDVKFEVWLPAQGWTGDFQPAGSGFWGGAIPFGRMRALLKGGSATVGTDLGLSGFSGPSFVLDHPEKLENMKMAPLDAAIVRAKTLITSFYGRSAQFTVMDECGGGGSRDVMAVVQSFPADLDAAVAVDFTNYGTRHGIAQMWLYDTTHRSPANFIPAAKLPMIHQAVLDKCDLLDGVKDGVLENPKQCKFDPAVLQCKGADGPTCLTAGQVDSVRRIYEMPHHTKTNEGIYGPMEPGSELGWEPMITQPEPYGYANSFYKNLVFKDPDWTYSKRPVNFDADIDTAETPAYRQINHTNPDLSGFINKGGKLLMVGGWVDDLQPQNVVSYYDSVVKKMGADKIRNSVRLFMVPGMHHCFGGTFPGAYKVDYDPVQTVKQWKATGRAPEQIVVTTSGPGWPTRKRLVCEYPQVSKYKGTGGTDDPANFTCQKP